MPALLLNPRAAREVAYVWAALSDACHYRAYELAPTTSELAGWISAVAVLTQTMREKAPAPAATANPDQKREQGGAR